MGPMMTPLCRTGVSHPVDRGRCPRTRCVGELANRGLGRDRALQQTRW